MIIRCNTNLPYHPLQSNFQKKTEVLWQQPPLSQNDSSSTLWNSSLDCSEQQQKKTKPNPRRTTYFKFAGFSTQLKFTGICAHMTALCLKQLCKWPSKTRRYDAASQVSCFTAWEAAIEWISTLQMQHIHQVAGLPKRSLGMPERKKCNKPKNNPGFQNFTAIQMVTGNISILTNKNLEKRIQMFLLHSLPFSKEVYLLKI